jgi:hypothetical protein
MLTSHGEKKTGSSTRTLKGIAEDGTVDSDKNTMVKRIRIRGLQARRHCLTGRGEAIWGGGIMGSEVWPFSPFFLHVPPCDLWRYFRVPIDFFCLVRRPKLLLLLQPSIHFCRLF